MLRRLKGFPGFGEQKAKIFLALLGKQYGYSGDGWREASAPYGEDGSYRSVADIVSPESLAKVREHKQRDEGRREDPAGRRVMQPSGGDVDEFVAAVTPAVGGGMPRPSST